MKLESLPNPQPSLQSTKNLKKFKARSRIFSVGTVTIWNQKFPGLKRVYEIIKSTPTQISQRFKEVQSLMRQPKFSQSAGCTLNTSTRVKNHGKCIFVLSNLHYKAILFVIKRHEGLCTHLYMILLSLPKI